jgi:hypothetical protein
MDEPGVKIRPRVSAAMPRRYPAGAWSLLPLPPPQPNFVQLSPLYSIIKPRGLF